MLSGRGENSDADRFLRSRHLQDRVALWIAEYTPAGFDLYRSWLSVGFYDRDSQNNGFDDDTPDRHLLRGDIPRNASADPAVLDIFLPSAHSGH